jgi:signal recognition particle subunit SRP68
MIECLDVYPAHDADLKKLVTFPPRVEPVPVKPLFLDVAWNYIEYPGRKAHAIPSATAPAARSGQGKSGQGQALEQGHDKGQAKKGWFGFGR